MIEKINDIIIVEGKDDVSAVKKAVNAEIIITHGFGLNERIEKQIVNASKRKAIIIFTDPDFAGERIRERVAKLVPEAKHAFLTKEEAYLDGDIGIENARPEAIIKALNKARCMTSSSSNEFKKSDMMLNGLVGESFSTKLRNELGDKLGIGYANGKQFLNRLNFYGITREEFEKGLKEILQEK